MKRYIPILLLLVVGAYGQVTTSPPGSAGGLTPSNNLSDVSNATTSRNNLGGLRVFDVKKDYGAVGDGSTDDTSSISSAISAMPSTGGVLYFPASSGAYKVTSGFTISKPITVLGDGGADNSSYISAIKFASGTGTLFTVTSSGCSFEKIALLNTNGTAPTSGAAVSITSAVNNITFSYVGVDRFYNGIDIQKGFTDVIHGCRITNTVHYGVYLRDLTSTEDGGDHSISDSYFIGYTTQGASAIRIESGGGTKITNCKINATGGFLWTNGVDVNLVGSNGGMSDVLVSNSSIEGYTGSGVSIANASGTTFKNGLIIGNEFLGQGTGSYGVKVTANTAGDISRVQINDNVFDGTGTTSPGNAVDLTNADNVQILGNQQNGFAGLYNLTTSTNVTVLDTQNGRIVGQNGLALTGNGNNISITPSSGNSTYLQSVGSGGRNNVYFNNISVGSSVSSQFLYAKNGTAKFSFGNDSGTSGMQDFYIFDNANSISRIYLDNGSPYGLTIPSGGIFGFDSGSGSVTLSRDTGISRLGAHSIALGNGTAGDFTGILKLTTLNVASGGSTTISTGVGSVKMSSANNATNSVWIPIQYNGTTYYIPGYTTNSP